MPVLPADDKLNYQRPNVKTFGRFSSHRHFEYRRIFPAGSLNQAIVGPTLSSWFTSEYKKSTKKLGMGNVKPCSRSELRVRCSGRGVACDLVTRHLSSGELSLWRRRGKSEHE